MFVRRSLILGVLVTGCGPESGVVPRTGVYDVTWETVANDCGRGFDDSPSMDAILFSDDRLTVGFPDFPWPNEKVWGGWVQSWMHADLERDSSGDGFEAPQGHVFGAWDEWDGCRFRRAVTAELPADDVVLTRVTYEWENAGACAWLGPELERCTLVRESTSTLREACDDCELKELWQRVMVLWAEENPLPE